MKSKSEILKSKYFKIPHIENLRDLLLNSSLTYKTKTAFRLKNENGEIYSISYENFANEVFSLGTKLLDLNLEGKSIAIVGKNSYEWIVSYLAASIVGVVVPIDKELHSDDIVNFLNISDAQAILGDSKILDSIVQNKEIKNKDLLFFSFHSETYQKLILEGRTMLENNDTRFEALPINSNSMHILLFTSGTTGNAKGVCLSHKNICSNIMSIASIVKVDSSTTVLSILPIHHTYECTIGILLPLYGGGTITFCEGLRHISNNIQEFKPSFILCVPLLLENMNKKILKSLQKALPEKYFKENTHVIDNLPFYLKPIVKSKIKNSLGGRMRTFIVGAAALNPALVDSLVKFGFKVLQGYGLTECSPLVAGNNDFFYKSDSAGLPIPNVEYQIENPDSEGVGEIIVKGPNVMLGYYNNPDDTSAVLKNGWFHTGDLGKIDSDGFLYITGRCKSVIVTKNGKNIYPEEIEYYLNDNPFITESIVLGVPSDEDDDTFVKAKILPDIDAIKDYLGTKIPSADQINSLITSIVQSINQKLPNYKHIKGFKIVDSELEKTTTKKVKRFGKNMDMK